LQQRIENGFEVIRTVPWQKPTRRKPTRQLCTDKTPLSWMLTGKIPTPINAHTDICSHGWMLTRINAHKNKCSHGQMLTRANCHTGK
jgi:hypothetical protein